MKTFIQSAMLVSLALSSAACSFAARSPEMYRDDTAALLETKSGEIKSCYDQVLSTNQQAQGAVRVNFTVQKDTGNIVNPTVDPNGTTAPPEVQSCVVNAINGLQLQPPDQDDGQATFTWEFNVEPAPGPAAPMEPAPT